jgi:hypothetical protein
MATAKKRFRDVPFSEDQVDDYAQSAYGKDLVRFARNVAGGKLVVAGGRELNQANGRWQMHLVMSVSLTGMNGRSCRRPSDQECHDALKFYSGSKQFDEAIDPKAKAAFRHFYERQSNLILPGAI